MLTGGSNERAAPPRSRRYLINALRAVVALAFAAAAITKLAAVPALVAVYDRIGLGQWFRYATVAVEIVGIIAVLIPRSTVYGALLLAATMLVAAFLCILVLDSNPFPALILSGACAWLAFLTREQFVLLDLAASAK